MKTSGQIFKIFQEADPDTIIRKPNLRRFCADNNIHTVINKDLHKPLYDFNEFLMKVNPKGVDCIVPMPIIRTFEQAVYEFLAIHNDIAEKITWNYPQKSDKKVVFSKYVENMNGY